MKKTAIVFLIFLAAMQSLKAISHKHFLTEYKRTTALKKFCKNHAINFQKTKHLASVMELRAIKTPEKGVIYITNDLGGGEWYYDENSSAPDNTGTVVGKFKRILLDNIVDIDWFGAAGDGVTDDTKKIQAAVEASRFKILTFNSSKTYAVGGGDLSDANFALNTVNIKTGDITLDGNGCKIVPYKSGGGGVFYLYNAASATQQMNINKVVFKNFVYDAKYGSTAFININGNKNMIIQDILITNNKFYNFSDANSGCIRISGRSIINTETKSSCSDILIRGNIFMNFGKFLNVATDGNYKIGDSVLAVSAIYQDESLVNQIQVGGYLRIASAETNLTKPGLYTGTNSIYKITGYKPKAGNPFKGLISIASGSYSNNNGFDADDTNRGLQAPIVKNAALLPIVPWNCPTLGIWPRFDFVVNSSVATRSSHDTDDNNKAKTLSVGSEFFINGVAGTTYKVKSIDANGNITLNSPFKCAQGDQQNKMIIKTGSLGNMIFINGDAQVLVRGNKMLGGSRAISGSIPYLSGVDVKKSPTSIIVDGNNVLKNFYMSIEFGNNQFLSVNKFAQFNISQGDTEFTIGDPQSYKFAKKDINGDGKVENCLTKVNTNDVTYLNSIIEGNIVSFEGVRGIYLIKAIPSNWPQDAKITISRYDWNNNKELTGGFIHSLNGVVTMKSFANAPMKIARQWNTLVIKDDTIQDSYGELLSVGCYNTKIVHNILNGIQGASLELFGENVLVDSNTINNTKWGGGRDRIGVACGYGTPLFGPLSCTASNLTFSNNLVNTWDTSQNPLSGQNLFNGYSENPGTVAFINNTFYGVSGKLFMSQSYITVNGNKYSSHAYYQKFVFQNNKIKLNIPNDQSSNSLSDLLAEQTEVTGNTFDFKDDKGYKKMFSTETPNPIMFPRGTFKINIQKNTSNKSVNWGPGQ